MKHYIVFENGQYHKIGASGFTPQNMVCECQQSDDLDVMDVVDNIDELTGEVVGKKLQFNEVKADAKQNLELNKARLAKLEKLRQLRNEKLPRVDLLVNIAVLYSWTATEKTELKNYREALLNITEPYKLDLTLIDALNLETIEWPVEPSEV